MKLIDALEILNRPISSAEASPITIALATGFTPLHLQTFLAAHLRKLLPNYAIQLKTGLFGDLAGNIERAQSDSCDVLAVIIEWQDLDQRLGLRTLSGWSAQSLSDIVESVSRSLARLTKELSNASASFPVCVCLPTLPLPPLFTTSTLQGGTQELQLRSLVASFAETISRHSRVRILSSQRLDECSAANARFDLKSELNTGFPYQLDHASRIAELLARLIQNPTPKKGLITDLDDTLWAGILGEVGVDGISWDLDHRTQGHGLYQQLLASLASAGTLLGVASKNDPALVQQALSRPDLILPKEQLFPVEVHWSRKSDSVRRILQSWNIAADAVVFIDDSPMEVAEVQSAFPELEAIVFPSNDHGALWDLLRHLRDVFGKSQLSPEDSIRLQSIRAAAALREPLNGDAPSLDDFLRSAEACIHISFDKDSRDARALELINKTNQFNLNGKRLSDTAWSSYLHDPATFLMTVSYQDKYGPCGKIAALLGRQLQGRAVQIDFWVMSCRVFSRRIEYQCLKQLFERFDAEELRFDYQPTARNSPLQSFFSDLLGRLPTSSLSLSTDVFLQKSPLLFHEVKEAVHA